MFSSLKKLEFVSLEQTKAYILPTDEYFIKEEWHNYNKVKLNFRNLLIFPVFLILFTLLIIYINDHDLGSSGIHGGAYITYPYLRFFAYFQVVVLVVSSILMMITYLKFSRIDRVKEIPFPEKNYNLTKYLSLFFMLLGLEFFMTLDLIVLAAPIYTIKFSVIMYVVLLLIYILLNFLIIIPSFSSQVGKIDPKFKESFLQKVTGSFLSFCVTYSLVFYVVYKIIWSTFPDGVHKLGDSSITGSLMVILLPLAFSVLPIYLMGEKTVKGFLISKYYNELVNDDSYKECLKRLAPPKSANVNKRS